VASPGRSLQIGSSNEVFNNVSGAAAAATATSTASVAASTSVVAGTTSGAGADFHMDSIFDDKDDDCTVDQTVASGPVLSSKRVPSFHDDGGASTKAAKVAKAAVSPLDLK